MTKAQVRIAADWKEDLNSQEFYERRSVKVWKQAVCEGRADENIVVVCFSGQGAGRQMGMWAGVWRGHHTEGIVLYLSTGHRP